MPVAGRKPKAQSRTRNKPIHDWIEVVNTPYLGPSPDLPGDREWTPATVRWWEVVRRMPHVVGWTEADWGFAIQTAAVADAFHLGDMRTAAELRNREKVLGTTADYRRDLRIRYVDAAPEVDDTAVASMAAYRRMVEQ